MSMFNKALLQSMLELVQETFPEAVEVVSYEEMQRSDGYCDTCYYEWEEVDITFISSETSEPQVYTYSGDFGELIRELTK